MENGFDKALGLKTGYMDFYKWYVECSTENVPPCVGKFRREIKDFICKADPENAYWSDVEQGLNKLRECAEIQPSSFDNLKKQILIVLHASKMFVLPEELKVKENASDILNEDAQNLALV